MWVANRTADVAMGIVMGPLKPTPQLWKRLDREYLGVRPGESWDTTAYTSYQAPWRIERVTTRIAIWTSIRIIVTCAQPGFCRRAVSRAHEIRREKVDGSTASIRAISGIGCPVPIM